jgi:Tfp pilus assembly protein PilO
MSIKPSTPVQMTDFQQIPLEIQIDAYFFSLLDFVYRLEKLQRIVNITGIDIKEGSLKLPNVEVIVRADAYVMTPGLAGKTAAASGAAKSGAGAGAGATTPGGTTSGTTSGTGGASQ